MKAETKITVAVRKRPLTRKELNSNETDVISVPDPNTVILREQKQKVDLTPYIEEHEFGFDACYGENVSNTELYEDLIRPLVASAFSGAKVSIFAYGQTGSGKTFTMLGDTAIEVPGIYLLAANDLYGVLNNQEFKDIVVGISFFEIYCDRTYDLLNNRNLCHVRSDAKENVHVMGLTEKLINNTESLMALINFGLSERITGSTGMNDQSSRSHAILQISLRNRTSFNKIHGKMTFIDLAGSERGADVRETKKQTRMDGTEINKSLLALKECIRALDLDHKHLPFRSSKLTQVLKDSFIGNCKTVMIGNISPAINASEHTLNTLRYSDRVKELKKTSKDKDKRDDLARNLMLPRTQKNSRIVDLPKRTGIDNIVFENYETGSNERKNKKVSMNFDTSFDKRSAEQYFMQEQKQFTNNPFLQNEPKTKINPQNRVFEDKSNIQRQPNLNKKPSKMKLENQADDEIEYNEELLLQLTNKQDQLIEEHSNHIDKFVNLVKEDMKAIQGIKDTPMDILNYIQRSKDIIKMKRSNLDNFQNRLDEFEVLLNKLESKKENGEGLSKGLNSLSEYSSGLMSGW